MNEWTATGEIFYLKELSGEFGASVKIKGTSQREGCFSTQVLELPCLLTTKAYEDAKAKKIAVYKTVTFAGHIETWVNKERKKNMFIADYIVEVA